GAKQSTSRAQPAPAEGGGSLKRGRERDRPRGASSARPFKKACGNAARAPVPTARRRSRLRRSAPGSRRRRHHQRQRLPEPLSLPGHRRQHWWWRRSWRVRQYLLPVLLVDGGIVSAAHGQCCQLLLRSSWWWNCKGSQVQRLRNKISGGRAQPADRRSHRLVDREPVAPPQLVVPALELPTSRGAGRPGRPEQHGELAAEDGEAAAALVLPRERHRGRHGHGLRLREAGGPDAAALLRRVAQGAGLLAGPLRRDRQPRLVPPGDPAVDVHTHGVLRLLRGQLPVAQR
ncbi:Growth-regulating factor 6, partial [Zea mays]